MYPSTQAGAYDWFADVVICEMHGPLHIPAGILKGKCGFRIPWQKSLRKFRRDIHFLGVIYLACAEWNVFEQPKGFITLDVKLLICSVATRRLNYRAVHDLDRKNGRVSCGLPVP